MAQQSSLTVTAAVEAFQVERRALQKMLAEGRLEGAWKDSRGRWLVPVAVLHQAGLKPRKTWISDANEQNQDPHEINELDANVRANIRTNTADSFANGANIDREHPHEINELDANVRANIRTNELEAKIVLLEAQRDAERAQNAALKSHIDDLRMSLRMLEAGKPQPEPVAEPPRAANGAEPRRRWWQRR